MAKMQALGGKSPKSPASAEGEGFFNDTVGSLRDAIDDEEEDEEKQFLEAAGTVAAAPEAPPNTVSVDSPTKVESLAKALPGYMSPTKSSGGAPTKASEPAKPAGPLSGPLADLLVHLFSRCVDPENFYWTVLRCVGV